MDITDWRRQFGLAAYGLALVGMALCLSISTPNEGTLILCSIGLIMIVICKAYVLVQVDSYGPELSQVQAEVGTAISGAFAWSLICNVLLVILWSLIGMGMTNSEYGLAVTIGSMILAALCSIVTYRRLPDVPAAHKLPEGVNIVQHTFRRFATLISETYRDYPDLGLIIFAGMLFDPALTAILAAAVSIMISRYSFSADQVTMILGLAIIAAIPAVPLSRWIPSTPSLTWLFNDAHDPNATVFPSAIDPKAPVGAGLEMTEDLPYLGVPTHPVDDAEAGGGGNGNGAGAAAEEGETAKMAPAASLTTTPNSSGMEEQQVGQGHKHVTVFHPYRVRAALIVGLALTILNTILLVQILTPCNFGLACLFSAIWGFLLSFCWNSNSMLRISVVPGGRESEFAGLYMAVFSSMIWLPLFVFSVANEVWSIGGALYILTIFMGLGGLVLFFVRLDRGLAARQRTLGMRRWVSTGKADAAAETGAGETA